MDFFNHFHVGDFFVILHVYYSLHSVCWILYFKGILCWVAIVGISFFCFSLSVLFICTVHSVHDFMELLIQFSAVFSVSQY